MRKEIHDSKEYQEILNNKSKSILNGFAIGVAVVILGEVAGLAICDRAIEGGFSSILEGKAMETTDFEDALDEYNTVQGAYNYYLSGGTSTYYIGDFDYSVMEREYNNAVRAGKKTYLKSCLDKKLIEYCNENPDAKSIDIQKIYEDVLWKIVLTDPTIVYEDSKSLEEYLEEYYGSFTGVVYADYKNLELTEEEQKTVQFIKK